MLVCPLFQVLAECLARDGQIVAIYQFILEEESEDFYRREKKANVMRTQCTCREKSGNFFRMKTNCMETYLECHRV